MNTTSKQDRHTYKTNKTQNKTRTRQQHIKDKRTQKKTKTIQKSNNKKTGVSTNTPLFYSF